MRIAVALGAIALLAFPYTRDPGAAVLRIAYTTELHGNLVPCACPVKPLGGLARRIGFIDSLRSAPDRAPLFVVDAGDMEPGREHFPLLGRDGREALSPLYRDAAFAIAYDAIAGVDLKANASRLVERGRIRVRLVSADENTDPANIDSRAKDGTDITVLLCSGDLHFAASAARRIGAQVAIASRGACYGGPIWQDGVLVLGPGSEGRYVGLARIEIDRAGRITSADVRLRPMDASVNASPVWRNRVESAVLAVERVHPGAFSRGE
jgi:2',3'-cyclic-nucleotide 2'-phosphodiesterase (5'-nucleotidase family)